MNAASGATVLVTGGAGYIGSHTALALARHGARVVIADDLSNSAVEAVDAVRRLAGSGADHANTGQPDIEFERIDLADRDATRGLFERHQIDAVMHFAGLKAVGESVAMPLRYYQNNLDSTLVLMEAMAEHGVFDLVFSSSATVYGLTDQIPIPETVTRSATNPYGQTKAMIEQICEDTAASDSRWRIALLRYFNPVGSDPSGEIGEDPSGIPNNLVPFVMQVAVGVRDEVAIFGDDYATPDGTGVRDYIHVVDLADGHIAALDRLSGGCRAYNLGTGRGASVLEVIDTARQVTGQEIPSRVVDRRPGDVAISIADPSRAEAELGWSATKTLADMLRDSWKWQSTHPDGYRSMSR